MLYARRVWSAGFIPALHGCKASALILFLQTVRLLRLHACRNGATQSLCPLGRRVTAAFLNRLYFRTPSRF